MDEPTKSRLPSSVVLLLTLAAANLFVYCAWCAGVWLSDQGALWLAWVLGVVSLLVVPLLTVAVGALLSGMVESAAAVPGTVASIFLMLGSLSSAPRLVVENPICESTFASAPEDAARCEFLCFSALEVSPQIQAGYTGSRKSGAIRHTFLAVGAPDAKAPYSVWVDEEDRERDGLCVWQSHDAKALASVRESPLSADGAIPGAQVRDPAASLWGDRKWLLIALGVLNGLALLLGGSLLKAEERARQQGKSVREEPESRSR